MDTLEFKTRDEAAYNDDAGEPLLTVNTYSIVGIGRRGDGDRWQTYLIMPNGGRIDIDEEYSVALLRYSNATRLETTTSEPLTMTPAKLRDIEEDCRREGEERVLLKLKDAAERALSLVGEIQSTAELLRKEIALDG